MSSFPLACVSFLSLALPDGLLGVAWPSMRVSLGQPVGALGLLLPFAVVSSMLSSASTGFVLCRVGVGWLLSVSTALSALALAGQALSSDFRTVIAAAVVLSIGSGAIDAGLNAHAARRFDARRITWMHACYGLGAATGPIVVAGTAGLGLSWRWAFGGVAAAQTLLAVAFAVLVRAWGAPPANERPRERGAAPRAAGPRESAGSRRRAGPAGAGAWSGVAVFALQTGLESSTALWAFVYLTDARGIGLGVAASTASAYWIALLVGRIVLGLVADSVGVSRVLAAGLVGMWCGAVLMLLPAGAPIVGIVLLGLAAAPMFPLLTLTTRDRVGAGRADRAVGVQVAASAAGAAVLPAAVGLLIGRYGTAVVGPCLVVLAVATAIAYAVATRRPATRELPASGVGR